MDNITQKGWAQLKKSFKNSIIFILTFLLQVELANAAEKPMVTLAGIDNYKPYSYLVKNKPEGIYIDIIRQLFSRAGYPVKIDLSRPFARSLKRLEQGSVTGIIGILYRPDRADYATYLREVPLTTITTSLFVLKDSTIKTANLIDIKGKIIAHKRKFVMSPSFESAKKRGVFAKYEVKSVKQLVSMLLARRVDGIIHSNEQTLIYINQLDIDKNIRRLEPAVIDESPSYLAFSKVALKKLPNDFFISIEQALKSMKEDGTLQKNHQ